MLPYLGDIVVYKVLQLPFWWENLSLQFGICENLAFILLVILVALSSFWYLLKLHKYFDQLDGPILTLGNVARVKRTIENICLWLVFCNIASCLHSVIQNGNCFITKAQVCAGADVLLYMELITRCIFSYYVLLCTV